MFNLVVGLIILPLILGVQSTITFGVQVGKLLLVLLPLILVIATIHWAAHYRLLRSARRALWEGNYDLALHRMDSVKSAAVHEFRGVVLALAGRPEEAEQILNQLPEVRDAVPRARRLDLVAEVFIDQGYWKAAKVLLEESIRLDAGVGSSHMSLAEWYLLQGIEPKSALDLIEQANTVPGFAKLRGESKHSILADRFATKAWALARLDRKAEAESAIADALRTTDSRYVPGFASTHWQCGMACAAMGQPGKAREYFQQANTSDPHGKYGKLALQALQALPLH
jgi:tetratricopeptide (TPR) repeat protein